MSVLVVLTPNGCLGKGYEVEGITLTYSLVGRRPQVDKEVKSKMSELVDPDLEGPGIPSYKVWAVFRQQ